MNCKYCVNGKCQVLLSIYFGSDELGTLCENLCKKKPFFLLRYFGVEFDADYDGSDLLEWVKAHGKEKNHEQIEAERKRKSEQAEAERQKLLAEMPKGFQLAPWLSKHLKQIRDHYKATGRIRRDPEAIKTIVTICRDCPSGKSVVDDNGHLRCVICGCHVEGGKKGLPIIGGKAEYDALHCERGHW